MKKIYVLSIILLHILFPSCDDFLNYSPTAVVSEEKAFQEPEKMVNAAYAWLGNDWYTYPLNLWPYGDAASDDCYKGGGGLNDNFDYHTLEIWSAVTPTSDLVDWLWWHLYCGISRCNRAIVSLNMHGDEFLGKDLTKERLAEVKFIRAHFYYKLLILFRQIPWVDEDVYLDGTIEKCSNVEYSYMELWQNIINDFKEAYDYLPEDQPDKGRVTRIAAAAYLAKCYLNIAWGDGYESTTGVEFINKEYMQKVVDYTDDVINSDYYYLEDFGDIFLPEFKNSKESIFAVQHSDRADDNTMYGRANWSNMLNGAWGIWTCGWDFHKPSQNLVNAFKTKNGLPMFDDFNDEIKYPINGKPTEQKWDPRLFHTVGMPTFPYKYESEYTLTVANSRNPSSYGYYTSLKEVPQRSKGETYESSWQAFAMNDYVFRFSDVMLMRAEALIELNRLSEAKDIINDIRTRAANSIDKHISYASDQCEISTYPDNYFQSKDVARECLRWERRLELAMENGRYFDLKRWGIASKVLNDFFETEQNCIYTYINNNGETVNQPYAMYYKDAYYTPEKNEFLPIPYPQMYYIPGLYQQNKNY